LSLNNVSSFTPSEATLPKESGLPDLKNDNLLILIGI
jgi:hypothetical protein